MNCFSIHRFSILLFLFSCFIVSLPAQFGGGSGTTDDPYLVSTADHLNNIRYHLTAFYLQTEDIDLDTEPYNEGMGWEPISTFSGSFNGNGNIIENLFIFRPGISNIGLFGTTNGANLHKIALVDVDITGGSSTGGLAGELFGASTVTECSVKGEITGEGNTGGMIGNSRYDSTIEDSYTIVTVIGDFPTGGLVGVAGHFNDSGNIYRCFTAGHATAVLLTNSFVGGIVGSLWNSTLSDSYNVGSLHGHYAGGLAARNFNGTIINSYATGFISGPVNDHLAGLVAQSIGDSFVVNSYWNVETTGQSTTSGGGEGLVTTEMVQQNTFQNWDFIDTWQIMEGESYPFLLWQGDAQDFNYPPPLPPANLTAQIEPGVESITLLWEAPSIGNPLSFSLYRDDGDGFGMLVENIPDNLYQDNNVEFMITYSYYITAVYSQGESLPSNTITVAAYSGFAGGAGTYVDPYLVATAEQLFNVRYEKDKYFLQIADIDFETEEGPWSGVYGFEPIGKGYNIPEHAFSGSYDGGNYTISNLFISRAISTVGLFGYVIGATLKNIGLIDVDVTGGMDTGALAGYAVSGANVLSCYSTGIVNAGSYGGGLIGRFEGGSNMIDCYSEAEVNVVTMYGGGLVGALYNNGVAIMNSYATGNVTSHSVWGGILGGLVGTTGGGAVISDTFATGNVSGTEDIGGLVGQHTQGATIWNSYSLGQVSGDYATGGLIGSLAYNPGPVSFCYWNMETSGQNTSQGGDGRTTAQMTYPYADNTYENWNFTVIWAADTDGDINNGYPYFYWIEEPPPSTVETPLFSPEPGWYFELVEVEITTMTEDAQIYYTLDGSDPEETSTLYTEPVLLAESTTLKARAYKDGWLPSDIAEGFYGIEPSEIDLPAIPDMTKLRSAYPNPFNPQTTISFSTNREGHVTIKVFNIKGNLVRILLDEYLMASHHKIVWDGKNCSGSEVASGIYFYRMVTDDYTATKRMSLIK